MVKTKKLDKDGMILPLAIAAIFLIGFIMFLYWDKISNVAEKLPEIKTGEELNQVLDDLDSENPDSMNKDVNGVSTDASLL